ncbi:hypothetical protein DL98DRAFT_599502 [Cadophora sp. DSE1049]|nr:hypothetical protein DL98DRAFT_599502 [Cadophora sp. DSE1049]
MSHGTASDKGWSQEALDFSTIPASDSLAPFTNHVFLSKAVSSSRLVPQVRVATQMLGWQPQVRADEHILVNPH